MATLKREWDQRIQAAQVRQMSPTEAAVTQRLLADIQRKIGPESALPSMAVMNRVAAQSLPTQHRSPEFDQRQSVAEHEPEPVEPQRDTVEVVEALNQKAQQTAQVSQQTPSPKADSVYHVDLIRLTNSAD